MMQGLLSLIQWLSPAFPTGGFAYSHGLETAISDGLVPDAAALRQWLTDVLEFGAGRQDAILLVQALRNDDHAALDCLARALQPSAERLTETLDQGSAFARTVGEMTGRALPARCLPIAVGEAAAALGLPVAQVVALYLHAFASNLTSVAMRFMPLGQEAGQGVLASLHPVIDTMATEAVTLTLDDLGSSAIGADLSAMAHETMDVRIFRT
ncbi:MAG: urease accessory protein UreF [Pseudotabrizicola sp.]|uniref:urease accessory protein UreF n=1 Tax=Pseudotabrizicola sp. TaxID=2939647 RepID=UPI002731E7A6|nr:urease accessory protein UreF [Pseudotabrizicola sp.]MDP2081484.1 urease accessory protein UreF [Pseudotabrizicola sp.]MDZ7572997.1 urease accessory protein UreF [Pseudotabrizicola sp.]